MPRVHLPDGRVVNFPDSMSAQDIDKALTDIHAPAKSEASAPQPEGKSVGGFIGNVVSSGGRFLKDTASGLYDAARLAGDMMPAGIAMNPQRAVERAEQAKQLVANAPKIASVAGQALKNRYGGIQQITDTLYNDPVGVLGDISTVAGGVGLAGKASGASKIARIAGAVEEATNPLRAITAPINALAHEGGVAAVRGTLRPPASVRDDFGGSRAIAEGVLKDRVYSEASAARKLDRSAAKADQMIADAHANLAPGVDTNKVANAVTGKPHDMAKLDARLGVADSSPELAEVADAIRKNNGVEIPLPDAQAMKQRAQTLAFEAGADNKSVKKAAEIAKAQALREGIEASIPGIKGVNEESQRLLGSKLAFAAAEDRPQALTNMFSVVGGLGGGAVGGPIGGLASAAAMKAINSPRAGAMAGIALDSFGRGMNAKTLRKAALVARLMEEANGGE